MHAILDFAMIIAIHTMIRNGKLSYSEIKAVLLGQVQSEVVQLKAGWTCVGLEHAYNGSVHSQCCTSKQSVVCLIQ